MAGEVRFIRKNGRIIPIRNGKAGSAMPTNAQQYKGSAIRGGVGQTLFRSGMAIRQAGRTTGRFGVRLAGAAMQGAGEGLMLGNHIVNSARSMAEGKANKSFGDGLKHFARLTLSHWAGRTAASAGMVGAGAVYKNQKAAKAANAARKRLVGRGRGIAEIIDP